MTAASGQVHQLDRAAVQSWLPLLGEWLLPGAFYGVQHTWPQLYRSDGEGLFFVSFDEGRLLSHCACRLVTVRGASGPFSACLLGSVATDPASRGQGHASQVLQAALAATAPLAEHTLLWAERPELYARQGFAAGPEETCLHLARRPRSNPTGVRLAEVRDHGAMHDLHERKPWRVERSPRVHSGLLTTPGMTTAVLERGGCVVAYACCGKGADLQGHWHEVGGSDEDVAELLAEAMHLLGQVEAFLLLPPYRPDLRKLLGGHVVSEVVVAGPMVRSSDGQVPGFWIDGLDSV